MMNGGGSVSVWCCPYLILKRYVFLDRANLG